MALMAPDLACTETLPEVGPEGLLVAMLMSVRQASLDLASDAENAANKRPNADQS